MEISVFAKKVQAKDSGRTFYKYLSTLITKDGEEQGVRVCFSEDCTKPKPEDCPINIIINKEDCNVSKKKYTDSKGAEKIARTLWVNKWSQGAPYVDNSLDEYDF